MKRRDRERMRRREGEDSRSIMAKKTKKPKKKE